MGDQGAMSILAIVAPLPLGIALLVAQRLISGPRDPLREDPVNLVLSTAGWTMVVVGLIWPLVQMLLVFSIFSVAIGTFVLIEGLASAAGFAAECAAVAVGDFDRAVDAACAGDRGVCCGAGGLVCRSSPTAGGLAGGRRAVARCPRTLPRAVARLCVADDSCGKPGGRAGGGLAAGGRDARPKRPALDVVGRQNQLPGGVAVLGMPRSWPSSCRGFFPSLS